jgi:riboflavin biosynthesis pyrimidine reductase
MKKTLRQNYSIFLSHSSRDSWLAAVLAERLRARGCSVWLDVMSLEGGQEVLRSIKEAIENADEAMVLVSPQSLRSQWVSVEIGMAEVLGKRITPILNHVEHSDCAPLASRKSYDLNDFDKFVAELSDRIV